jgi:hypothetical protein
VAAAQENIMDETDKPAFTGWHRPGAAYPWRRIVEAEGEDDCWAMLLSATIGGDLTVTASHRDANERLDKPERSWNSA